jgi:glucosyl-dolichyl phosphate glucuronosyltransferase
MRCWPAEVRESVVEEATFSVVICAYTEARWDALVAAVDSVVRQSLPPKEIVVVIDHNSTLLMRVCQCLPMVMASPNREANGLSGARNTGIRLASGTVVAFIDDDAAAAPDWLERLAKSYRRPEVLGSGGSIEPQWQMERPIWFPEEFDWVVGCTYRGMPDRTTTVRNLIGCNMSFKRAELMELGGFRHGIGRVGTRPLGCEETELSIRAMHRYPTSVLEYVPAARVFHQVPSGRANWRYFRARCYSEGLSKAVVTRLVGRIKGLESERRYTFRTLPVGVLRGVVDGLRLRPSGLARAGAIVLGLLFTAAGYLAATLSNPTITSLSPAPSELQGGADT